MPLRSITLLLIAFSSTVSAQQQAPAPPPQTARQALVEMFTGGQKAAMKHLTVEVQQLLAKVGNKSTSVLAVFDSIRNEAGSDMQTFETGPVLFSMNQPSEHAKLEVRVENDDLSGDEDAMELSFHMLRDGREEQAGDWGEYLSHIAVNMKRQQGIWRLNKIGVALEFRLGDPAFLERMLFKGEDHATGVGVVAPGARVDINTDSPEVNVPPEQLVTLLGFAENSFARQHPDVGFTCSFSEISEAGKAFGLNQQLSSGTYQGYKLTLTGCEGKPAGSFQVIAEPIVQGKGAKAYCTDATQNLRVADDGRGSNCLAFGKAPKESDDTGSVVFDVTQASPSKPKQ